MGLAEVRGSSLNSMIECEAKGIDPGELERKVSERTREMAETVAGLEQEIVRLQRWHLMGEITAGIVHEIRNPITIMRGFLQILREKSGERESQEYFDLMLGEVDRVSSMVNGLLSLSGDGKIDNPRVFAAEAADLNKIIERLYPLIAAYAAASGKRIEIKTEEVPHLLLDEQEIRQLVLNMVSNGLDAMEAGGTLTISTFKSGNCVVLVFADQGRGIEPNLMGRLGTPFLTTKGSGTGLGLTVCRRIAERHKARIRVKTGPDGTTFFVCFSLNNKQNGKNSANQDETDMNIMTGWKND